MLLKVLMAILCSVNFITGPFTKLKTDTSKLGGEVVSVYKDISKQIISKKDDLKLTEKEVKEIENLSKKLEDVKTNEEDKKSAAKELYSKFKVVVSRGCDVLIKTVGVTFGLAVTYTTLFAIVANSLNLKIEKDGEKYKYKFEGKDGKEVTNIFAKGACALECGFSKLLDFSRFKIGEKS